MFQIALHRTVMQSWLFSERVRGTMGQREVPMSSEIEILATADALPLRGVIEVADVAT